MDFAQLAAARHSAVNFEKDFRMTEQDFKQIFELTKLAPSVYNLQLTNYFVITDEEKKEALRDLHFGQYKIHTASAAVLVLGNRQSATVESAEKMYMPMKMLQMMDECEYNATIESIAQYANGLDEAGLRDELVRNASLHAMLFMLAAKHYGFDTCPMHVHNVPQLRELFSIPAHLEPIMLITIGKSVDKERPRGYRKPVNEFVQFNSF
ncbi:nitroreductase family protein [Caryophanon latum]|uniref:Nitroreductase n=1 Tax=Caryophanon latum TaxID=33977 RepID=A0A1C0Z2Y9_9BACL|nr:nitroreductase family protein [Caryophanon latum]OCS93660.1 nitroreductase [Caryophanon latum]